MAAAERKISIFFPVKSEAVKARWEYLTKMIKAMSRAGMETTLFCASQSGHFIKESPDFADTIATYDLSHENAVVQAMDQAITADIILIIEGTSFMDLFIKASFQQLNFPDKLLVYWSISEKFPGLIFPKKNCVAEKAFEGFDLVLSHSSDKNTKRYFMTEGTADYMVLGTAVDTNEYLKFSRNRNEDTVYDMVVFADPEAVSVDSLQKMILQPASRLFYKEFCLVGRTWDSLSLPSNVKHIRSVSKIELRDILASGITTFVFSNPADVTGYQELVLKAAACGSVVFTDSDEASHNFFKQEDDILVTSDPFVFERTFTRLSPIKIMEVAGNACRRILANHTYNHRIDIFKKAVNRLLKAKSVKYE